MAAGRPISRRRLLAGGAAATGAVAIGARAAHAESSRSSAADASAADAGVAGDSAATATVDCFGPHQAGIATTTQANVTLVGLTINEGAGRTDLVRLMRLWSDDIARLTSGRPTLADPVAELATIPARLTITVGFGPGVFEIPGLESQRPPWLTPLPAFKGDALRDEYTGGDLLLQVGSDDPVTVSHAVAALTTAGRDIATPIWTQSGFHRAAGMSPAGTIGRNLMGFVDGIINPEPGTADFDRVVWNDGSPGWLAGGTGMVLRRVRIDTDGWSSLSRRERELSVGRDTQSGAPLTGGEQSSAADLTARDEYGLDVIPAFAHIRVAAPTNPDERIFRRSFNYDDGFVDGVRDQGSLFIAYAADVAAQFVPIQQRLAEEDLMHTWLTATGSAVFAIPPGFTASGWLGESLLGA